jgi:hypothetical protein
MSSFISRNFAAGSPSGSCYTILDANGDVLVSDVRSSPTQAAHSPVIYPNGLHSAVWGTDSLEYGRFGYLQNLIPNEIHEVTDEATASFIAAGRPFPTDRIERYMGYQGTKALFWSRYHGSYGGYRVYDAEAGAWEDLIDSPSYSLVTLCFGQENRLGPDGKIWAVDNTAGRNLWVYDGSWTDLGPSPVTWGLYEVFVNDEIGPYILGPSANVSDAWPTIHKWNGSAWELVLDGTDTIYLTNANARGGVLLGGDKLAFCSVIKPGFYGGSYDYIYGIVLVDLTLRDQTVDDVLGIGFIDTTEIVDEQPHENELAALSNVQKMIWGASDQEFYYSAVGRILPGSQMRKIRYDADLRESDGVYHSLVGARISGRGDYTGTTDPRLDMGAWWASASGGQKDVGFAPRESGAALPPPVNVDFSSGSRNPGEAAGWTSARPSAAGVPQILGSFKGSVASADTIEKGWSGNHDSLEQFSDQDLVDALLQDGGSSVDGAEAGWDNIELAKAELPDANTLAATSSPESAEDWENADQADIGYADGPSGGAATTTDVQADSIEADWRDNDSATTGYTDSPVAPGTGTKAAATIDGGAAETVETGTSTWISEMDY